MAPVEPDADGAPWPNPGHHFPAFRDIPEKISPISSRCATTPTMVGLAGGPRPGLGVASAGFLGVRCSRPCLIRGVYWRAFGRRPAQRHRATTATARESAAESSSASPTTMSRAASPVQSEVISARPCRRQPGHSGFRPSPPGPARVHVRPGRVWGLSHTAGRCRIAPFLLSSRSRDSPPPGLPISAMLLRPGDLARPPLTLLSPDCPAARPR